MTKDIIEIKQNKINVHLSYIIKKGEKAYIGYIPSFNIPFTSPTKEKASDIANGLIKALFTNWLKRGKIDLLKSKLEKFNFTPHKQFRFEHTAV